MLYLPMIDMDLNDLSCVYSTLCYVSSHAKKHNVTPIMTLILISHFGGKHFKYEKVCLKIVISTPHCIMSWRLLYYYEFPGLHLPHNVKVWPSRCFMPVMQSPICCQERLLKELSMDIS